jgi:leader peptidase (prepilin peptidase)/N-methyltransferase
VAATFARRGFTADACAWAAVELVLVGVAAYDFTTRRVKNVVTVTVSVLAILFRAAFERSALAEVVFTGLIVFLVFFALSIFLRGGLGMGDVKLAAMLGFLLGQTVLSALLLGTIVGGVAALATIYGSGTRRATMAYGPYLALGGAVAILAFHPPPLV